jgi:hypothetical protein
MLADEIPQQDSRAKSVMPQPSATRYDTLWTNMSLFIVFHLQRWVWKERGVYSFLCKLDREHVANTCYASRREHLERITDDVMILSPTHDNGETTVSQA